MGSIYNMAYFMSAHAGAMSALAGRLTQNLLTSPILEPAGGGNVSRDAHKDQSVILAREALWLKTP